MVGIGHLGADRKGPGLGVYLRVGEIDQSAQGIGRPVGEGDGDVGVPRAGGIAVPEIDVAGLGAQVFERRHAEVDTHRIALDDGSQERLPAGTDEGPDVGVALGNIARHRRPDGGITQRELGLREVGLANDDVGRGALVSGDGIVEVELAGGVLLVERTDAVQVALGLQSLRPGLVELGPSAVGAGAVELRVDDEEGLPLIDIGTLGEEHPFEVTLDAGADFDELLGANTPHILAVDIDVLRDDGLDGHDGQHLGHGPVPQHVDGREDAEDHDTNRPCDPTLQPRRNPPEPPGQAAARPPRITGVSLQQQLFGPNLLLLIHHAQINKTDSLSSLSAPAVRSCKKQAPHTTQRRKVQRYCFNSDFHADSSGKHG
jgi:hypothetical protein